MKKLILILLLINLCFSQIKNPKYEFFEATAFQTGYSYLGKNYSYIGFDKRIDDQKTWAFTNIGVGTYVSYFENKTQFVPEFHTNITFLLLLAEVSVTNKAINPSLGFNIYNKYRIKSGYNFTYRKDDFKGITFGVNINLGSDSYHYLSPMKLF
jgi:hypothetical protein